MHGRFACCEMSRVERHEVLGFSTEGCLHDLVIAGVIAQSRPTRDLYFSAMTPNQQPKKLYIYPEEAITFRELRILENPAYLLHKLLRPHRHIIARFESYQQGGRCAFRTEH